MPRTNIQVNGYIPTESIARAGDLIADIRKVFADHKAADFHFQINSGNEAHDNGGRLERAGSSGEGGTREISEQGRRAAADFADEGDGTGSAAEPVKRGRGRPRKSDAGSAEEARSAGGQRDGGGKASGGSGQERRGNEPQRTQQGSDEGTGQGTGRRRGAQGSGDDQRGAGASDRVKADDWNEPADQRTGMENGGADTGPALDDPDREKWWAKVPGADWPDDLTPEDIDENTIAELLSEHFAENGGKSRGPTLDIMEKVAGVRVVREVSPDDFDALARALCKDIAQIKYGIKKAAA